MMLLMDGPVRTAVNHPSGCLPGAPGGRPGGCADAEELVSAKWQAPLMEIMSGSGSAGTGTGVGPETATARMTVDGEQDGENAVDFGACVARAKTRSRRESASGGEPLASAHNEPAGGSEKVVDKVDGDDKDGGGDGEGELDDGRR